jgi:RNA polymerase sigma-70 factor (ECF subfamily)
VRQFLRRPSEVEDEPADDACDASLVFFARTNADAFDRLYERYETPILNYCYYRLGAWPEAEDAAQQIFTNAFAGLAKFQVRAEELAEPFRSWLFTIAHHEVANRKRGFARHPQAPLVAAAELSAPGPSPEELAVIADDHRRVLTFLAQLSGDQRQVVELRFAGLSDVEIGSVLGRTPGAVRAVQARAVARLRELLGIRPTGMGDSND